MHTVLHLPDTLSLILSHVGYKESLRNCASVCKAWFGPASKILWSNHARFASHLLWVFSAAGLLEASIIPGGPVTYFDVTSKAPQQKDWDRVYLYSRNIRKLHLSYETIFTHACVTLLSKPLTAKNPLFPLIRNIHMELQNGDEIDFGHFLLSQSPGISDLSISLVHLEDIPESFWDQLHSVAQRSTELQRFSVYTREGVSIPSNILTSLAFLPKIRDIAGLYSTGEGGDIGVDAFLNLERISWGGSLAATFFQSSWFPPPLLRTLVSRKTTADSLHAVVRLMSLRNTPIRRLVMEIEGYFYPAHLHAISSLRHLEALTLTFKGGIAITDGDFEHLASGLPKLKDLYFLEVGLGAVISPQISHRGIEQLITHCLNLRSLLMMFDAYGVPPITRAQRPSLEQPEKNAATLMISPMWSKMRDPASVSVWLIACCGRRRRPQVVHPYTTDSWAVVHRLLEEPHTIQDLLS